MHLLERDLYGNFRVSHITFHAQYCLNCSRYPSKFRCISTRLSPPNFSREASARTMATIDSPITPAAGTATISDRSNAAADCSFETTSMLESGCLKVDIGFKCPLTLTSSPLVMPPS